MQDAFALMLEVDAEVPGFFSSGRQVFHAEIDRIGGEPQDPVAVSLNGEHDSAYGGFIHYARSCLFAVACADSLNPTLGKLVHAGEKLRAVGAGIDWQNIEPGVDLWLCNDNNDCALVGNHEGTGSSETGGGGKECGGQVRYR